MWQIFAWIISQVGETAFGKLILNALEKQFPKLFRNKTKEIVGIYESRINEKNQEIQRLHEERQALQQQHTVEQNRISHSLKRRSISVEKLIEKYHKPLNAALISYATQREDLGGGRIRESHFIKDELARYNAKYLGGTESLIPPISLPSHIKSQKDLEGWFSTEILKGRYCKLKYIIIFDIRNGAYWGTFLPFAQKKPIHRSIGEVLRPEDIFTDEQINTIAISDVINSGDIAWLASTVVAGDELQLILQNQKLLEERLQYPPLRLLADEKMKGPLADALAGVISSPAEVANAIVEEAIFWYARIKG